MTPAKTGRNDPCPCGSGKKFKKCCLSKPQPQKQAQMANREKDISTEIKAALPNELTAKLDEIEKFLGKGVVFLEVPKLYGEAPGAVAADGRIYIATASKADMAVAGEELMHLHRWTSGFPKMKPQQRAVDERYNGGIYLISGMFEETAFFPFLEGLGLNPRKFVDAAMPATARRLPNMIPEVELGETDELRVTLAGLYTQAKIMTSGEAGDQVLKVFEQDALQPYTKIGHLVCEEIVAAQNEDADAVGKRMETTLFTHLGLKRDAVEVRPEY